MRLISQDGTIDVPYEQAIVEYEACERNGEDVFYIIFAITEKSYFSVAKYLTESKAQNAMEMLHIAYTGMPVVFQNVELGDDVKKMFADFRKNGIILHSFEDTESKVEYINNVIFQFPKDEDVEV